MEMGRRSGLQVLSIGALVVAALVSCTPGEGSGPQQERPATSSAALFTNGGFETGTPGSVPPAPWSLTTFLNPDPNGITLQTPQTYAGLNLVSGSVGACTTQSTCPASGQYGSCQGGQCQAVAKTVTLNSAAGTGTQTDPTLGPSASLRWPRYGNRCALVNQLGNLANVNQLSQTMTVSALDIDPSDNQVHVRLVVAPVLEDPGHTANQQPYVFVQVTNVTQSNAVVYSDFSYPNQPGVPWQTINAGIGPNQRTYRYTNWQVIDVAGNGTNIAIGDQLQLVIVAAGCSLGEHMGQAYVDGVGPTLPGLNISGTGPAQANPGANITYTLTERNGSPQQACTTPANCNPTSEACVAGVCAETGAVIDFTTPPSTTFQSMTQPSGAICVTPSVGAAGTITCTFSSPIPPGFATSFTVTVALDAAATGTLVAGNYDTGSTQETSLLGAKILTRVGCAADTDCPTGTWCDEANNACTAPLANGAAIPNDPSHTNPTLNGMCTPAAGALVCSSKVCDPADNLCGYANGDGPCDANTGSAVCRSGACSVTGTCEPSGGCNVDLDCMGGLWCAEATHTCTAKLANGAAIPSDPPHSNPTLDGTCTAPASALVCSSGVCDTGDNACGYANGDGPCDASTGTTICRSTRCAVSGPKAGLCVACTDDSQCSDVTPICDVTQGACVACNGDQGSSASDACSTTTAPWCGSSGACGSCTLDSDCTTGTHAGPVCDTTTGACTTAPDAGQASGSVGSTGAGAGAGASSAGSTSTGSTTTNSTSTGSTSSSTGATSTGSTGTGSTNSGSASTGSTSTSSGSSSSSSSGTTTASSSSSSSSSSGATSSGSSSSSGSGATSSGSASSGSSASATTNSTSSGSTSSGSTSSGAATSGSSGGSSSAKGGGCGCSATPGDAWGLLALALTALRRRRARLD